MSEPTPEALAKTITETVMDILESSGRYGRVESYIETEISALRTKVAKLEVENQRMRAAHNGEVCVDTMEHCERLEARVKELEKAELTLAMALWAENPKNEDFVEWKARHDAAREENQ